MAKRELASASNLLQIGAQRLALLGKHHKLLMQAYLNGFVDEASVSEAALKKLLAARILWRPGDDQPLTLRPLVSELIASMVADENRRQINADVAEKLEQVRVRVRAYQDAQAKGDYTNSELQLQRLSENVFDLSGQFEEAIDSLWHRLNSDFGFVASLDDKIRENQRAQSQLRRLLDGLELIDFEQLITLCEGSNGLRKLLVSQLQVQLSEHHSSLLEVQKRLVELLAKFRHQQARSLLIANTVAFLREHPNYRPSDYPNRSKVPSIFNRSAAIIPSAGIAIDRSQDRDTLSQVVRDIPRPSTALLPEQPKAATYHSNAVDDAVALRQQQLKLDVENFYLAVIDAKRSLSALEYLSENELSWDKEIWLYQIIAEYQALPRAVQKQLTLNHHEQKASMYNDLRLIEDIQLST